MKHKRQRGAFTLMELLVSISIFSVLVVMLASMAQTVGSAWVSTQKRTSRQQNARAILDFIARDLQTAVAPIVSADQKGLQMIFNPDTLAAAYKSGDTVFWQAPNMLDATSGDLAILGYFIRWTAGNGTTPPKASLCRLVIPPSSQNYLIYQSPNDWINKAVVDAMAPATADTNYEGLMAENVLGFWAEPLDRWGEVITPLGQFDSREGYKARAPKKAATDPDNPLLPYPPGSLPKAVRISIVTIDSRTAALLPISLQFIANQSKNADDFIDKVRTNASYHSITNGIQAHTTSVTLVNSQ